MKSFLSYALAFLFSFIILSSKVHAYENKSILNKSQIIIAKKYAELFCSAKADHFFEGLENEKTLKYSYFKYIGLTNEEAISKDIYNHLITQIRKNCLVTNEEEKEINEFLIEESQAETKLFDISLLESQQND